MSWHIRAMHLAGPPPQWLIGNLGPIIKFGYPKALQQWAQQYGPVFRVGMLWQDAQCMLHRAVAMYCASMKRRSQPVVNL